MMHGQIRLVSMRDNTGVCRFGFYDSRFGEILIVSDNVGICSAAFSNGEFPVFERARSLYPDLQEMDCDLHHTALSVINGAILNRDLPLHVQGTEFQISVWHELLKIERGTTLSYLQLAKNLGIAGASRAAGNAVAKNPVAYLIPCHRVIRSTGETGEYMWGPELKKRILASELNQTILPLEF